MKKVLLLILAVVMMFVSFQATGNMIEASNDDLPDAFLPKQITQD